ncbi:DUF4838 domain-containing protein [Thermogutta sp.]|uniref:DUF4838 domain-containing protein n=1 Tax=Thermogutta sp. TaxID=1962930 RepID=UPI003220583A
MGTATDFPEEAKAAGLSTLGPEGVAVWTDKGRLWLLGNSPIAVSHAVSIFLEELGFRWYFPDPAWTVTPRLRDVAVQIRKVEQPGFAWRRIWYGWGARTPQLQRDYDAWMRHNRQGGAFRVDCGHAWERYIPAEMFASHPEWFALVKGKRQPPQLCVSNPELQNRFTEAVLEFLRRHPEQTMVSVEPNDGGGYCECPNCRAIGNGSVSDQVFFLANLAARAVRKEFPGKYIGLYAYAHHADPPSFALEPNVYVQITTGFRYTTLSWEDQIRAFRQRGAQVGVYDYFSVYPWDWDLPGAAKAGRVFELAKAVREYHTLGLTTYDAESSCNWGPNGPGYWIAAHLMWNPQLDAQSLFEDFCTRAFETAAAPMRRLYERWSRGERFSPRSLKLALQDLDAAYQATTSPEVVARLDRVAMYLHWLRLWLEYDQSSRRNQWNRLVVASPEEIIQRAQECVVFSHRIMDTGLIHTFPMLFSSWFEQRFAALKLIDGFDLMEARKTWTGQPRAIPTHEEVAQFRREDLKKFETLQAVEIEGRTWRGPLRPATELVPDAVASWRQAKSALPAIESGEILFLGREGEELSISWQPFDKGHTILCDWLLRKQEATVASGRVEAPKGTPAHTTVKLPENALYVLNPGTDFWRAARINIGDRPFVLRAAPADTHGAPSGVPLRFWFPAMDERLYFYVPQGTRHFVLGIVSGGDPWTQLRIQTADGRVIVDDRVLAGSEISVIVEQDQRTHGADSAMANHSILPSSEQSEAVPKGADGQIWSLQLSGLRCVVELYDVPPYLACTPQGLLIPEDAISHSQSDGTEKAAQPAQILRQ